MSVVDTFSTVDLNAKVDYMTRILLAYYGSCSRINVSKNVNVSRPRQLKLTKTRNSSHYCENRTRRMG